MKYYQYQKLQHFYKSLYQGLYHEPFPSNAIPLALSSNLLLPPLLVNLTVPNKQFFSEILLVGLHDQVFNSWNMYKFKIEVIYKIFGTKTKLLNVKFTLELAKLNMVCSRLLWYSSLFSYDKLFHYYLILGI